MQNKIIVIKIGGNVLSSEKNRLSLFTDIKYLKTKGFYPVIVHGGGKYISYWLEKTGVPVKFVKGLRYTDKNTIDIVEMVLSGYMNKSLVGTLTKMKIQALGISGRDDDIIIGKKVQGLGLVAKPSKINGKIIVSLLKDGFVPVISPVSSDGKGNAVNINADDAAEALASSLKAFRLIFITDVNGVLKDINKKTSTIDNIYTKDINKLIKEEIINGGMIPKIKSSEKALKKGVKEIDIVNGNTKGILKACVNKKHMAGTRINNY